MAGWECNAGTTTEGVNEDESTAGISACHWKMEGTMRILTQFNPLWASQALDWATVSPHAGIKG
jgi:hypothetical protein